MSNVSKRKRDGTRPKIKSMGDHEEFLKRIEKTLYYGKLPSLPCLSLPVTELSCSLWSMSQRGRSLRRLHAREAAGLARGACVSPCALVLAMLYLERLRASNPDYLAATAPHELFLVSLMVSNKFLQDDGEDDEVLCSEWATSGGVSTAHLKRLEIDFLNAIDWNVYVSDDAFESGLLWLEREVALREGLGRGFFTYTDLTAVCDATQLTELYRSLSHACASLALAYVASIASLAAIIASTLVISQACLPLTQLTTPDVKPTPSYNATHFPDTIEPKCCTKWLRYHETAVLSNNFYLNLDSDVWPAHEPWWARASVGSWLYQTSLIDPAYRWLEKLSELAQLVKSELFYENENKIDPCHGFMRHTDKRCMKQSLNFSKLNAFLVAVSDR